ncbi:hypothetical protein IX41_06260 [Kocuria rhizophila]|nr:hypothetical protein IX41_06260 [Kocuria rhizophila]
MNRKIAVMAQSRVHSSHGVRTQYWKPSSISRSIEDCGDAASCAPSPPRSGSRSRSMNTSATAWHTAIARTEAPGRARPVRAPPTAGPAASCSRGRAVPSTPLAASSWWTGRIRGSAAE